MIHELERAYVCIHDGVDVDLENVSRILARADAIEPVIGISRDAWFEREIANDAEFPGGRHTRSRVHAGEDGTLVCAGDGLTLYHGARGEIAHYFGASLVRELDTLEALLTPV